MLSISSISFSDSFKLKKFLDLDKHILNYFVFGYYILQAQRYNNHQIINKQNSYLLSMHSQN